MKPLSYILLLFLLCHVQLLSAQSGVPTAAIDGKYYLLTAERSPKGGNTNEMLMQFTERNGQQMLVVAACEQGCTPMVYTYQKEASMKMGSPIFFNSFGYYMLTYDENSFVSVIPDAALGKDIWRSIRYSNFYSKDAEKTASMTSEKVQAFAIGLSEKMVE